MGDLRAKPLQYAAQGERGYGEMIDYRGEPVMAVVGLRAGVPLGPRASSRTAARRSP